MLAKEGIAVGVSDLFGKTGRDLLAGLELAPGYRWRVDSLVGLIDHFDRDVGRLRGLVDDQLAADPGYVTIQTIPGVGPVLAAVFVAEIGDVHRFPRPANLCSWAGLTPRHYESDITVRRGHITKQGSKLVRWAAVEAVQ